MKALLIIAHGSRRKEANDEFITLVQKIRNRSKGEYEFVKHAFLEFYPPTLSDTVTDVITQGANEIYVFPYFLNSGNHVTRDIPALVHQMMQSYPECDIRLLPSLGTLEGMEQWVIHQIQANVSRRVPTVA